MRRAHKVDANQAAIVDALRQAGCTVAITSGLGKGFPDLVVGARGAAFLLEVKQAGASLTPDEERFRGSWAGHYAVVRSPEEALAAILRAGGRLPSSRRAHEQGLG